MLCNFSIMARKVQPRGRFLSYNNSIIGFTDTASLVVKSSEYEYGGSLPLLTGLIDLSCNNLSSEIPEELTGLQGLMFSNLSVNHSWSLLISPGTNFRVLFHKALQVYHS